MSGRRWGLALLAASSFSAAWFLYSEPHIRAYLCPPCSGFHKVAPRVYVDRHATDDQIAVALQNLQTAEDLVLEFHPARASDPLWLLCLSGQCGVRTIPRPLAMSYMDLFLFVYPDGATPTILAHELAHAELHQRVDSTSRLFSQAVPTWFDEGLAVVISRDPRYVSAEDDRVIACKADTWSQPPSDQRTFRRLGATQAQEIYTASACKVIDWIDRHGGAQAVLPLLQDLRAGGTFLE